MLKKKTPSPYKIYENRSDCKSKKKPLIPHSIHENKHLMQPERLYQRTNMKEEQKKILIALGFCVVAFFLYLYG